MKTEDHSLSALIVKEDGLIYVNRVPEEPQHFSSDYLELRKAQQDYEAALASAKESAIKCVDQEQATERLIKSGVCVSMEINKPLIAPGIYPIPDLQWEVDDRRLPHYPKVAILKESTPTETKNENRENIDVKLERGKESEITLYVRNLLATASNIIGVIEGHQWERLPSKAWDLKFAHDELKKRYDAIDQHRAAFDKAVASGKGQEYIDNIVAKESTPSTEKEESQDELWKQARHLIEIWDIDGLFKQFIITRKP